MLKNEIMNINPQVFFKPGKNEPKNILTESDIEIPYTFSTIKTINNIMTDIIELNNFDQLSNKQRAKLIKRLKKINLLTHDTANTKTKKSSKLDQSVKSYILHLYPYQLPEYINGVKIKVRAIICSAASLQCIKFCLNTAGQGGCGELDVNITLLGRVRKTLFFQVLTQLFMSQLVKEIKKAEKKSKKDKFDLLAVRLNGTSDIPYENIRIYGAERKNIFECFPQVQFYDYTAVFHRLDKISQIPNYDVTWSIKEDNIEQSVKALSKGFNASIVLDSPLNVDDKAPVYTELKLGDNFYQVINGDEHDLRFKDAKRKIGSLVILEAKGQLRKPISSFKYRNVNGQVMKLDQNNRYQLAA